MTEQRIYAACLASYNSGILHGAWIDASADVEEMQAAINEMLARSPEPNVTRQAFTCLDCREDFTLDVSSPREFQCQCGGKLHPDEDGHNGGKPYPSAEEWAIHDHEGLGDLREFEGLRTVAFKVGLGELADDKGVPFEVMEQFARERVTGDDLSDVESAFDDAFAGMADSFQEWSDEWCGDALDFDSWPETARNYFDWEAFARDLRHDFDVMEAEGGVYVFYL